MSDSGTYFKLINLSHFWAPVTHRSWTLNFLVALPSEHWWSYFQLWGFPRQLPVEGTIPALRGLTVWSARGDQPQTVPRDKRELNVVSSGSCGKERRLLWAGPSWLRRGANSEAGSQWWERRGRSVAGAGWAEHVLWVDSSAERSPGNSYFPISW